MQPKSKVELYAAIRCDSRAGLASRALQRKYGVGFRTVEKALASDLDVGRGAAIVNAPRKSSRQRTVDLTSTNPRRISRS
ncbi:hypothetical protein AB0B45_44390 [Nonomuraea sp. NPDC049152]|uniref:hypothetical protein n=1 Tax=Nonomuraea sp. NPDC049152 TaxID=3154350 RepID=UPI0033E2DE4B